MDLSVFCGWRGLKGINRPAMSRVAPFEGWRIKKFVDLGGGAKGLCLRHMVFEYKSDARNRYTGYSITILRHRV